MCLAILNASPILEIFTPVDAPSCSAPDQLAKRGLRCLKKEKSSIFGCNGLYKVYAKELSGCQRIIP